jgi:molybdopterin-containing oxidoreductase family iron-sulfur binding subunit
MQELPDPLTKLVWDNAALMSAKTAAELGVHNGEVLKLGAEGGQSVEAPAWILPGHADWSITLTLGYGRELGHECKVSHGAGVDVYPLRTADRQHLVTGVRANKTGGTYKLVVTQDHGTMAGRPVVRENSLKGYQDNPTWAPQRSPLDKQARVHGKTEADLAQSLWLERGYGPGSDDPMVAASPYQWGMVIDLNACTGCSACVVACAAENNIPMVGKIQVARGREMFWIRSDRYFGASDAKGMEAAEDPVASHMPVPCQQCENAPCESVCPVAATTHSPDGLNDMAYNRCIGTRYCNNNCPYKVRRFNYLDFVGNAPPTKQMSFNPDVTIRNRGVMEKCTYCVQRINGARIRAKIDKREVQDGEITPACAQACPTEAITFGNLLKADHRVSKLKRSPLNYGLLSDLNTKPRTTYLGRVRNPNPELG